MKFISFENSGFAFKVGGGGIEGIASLPGMEVRDKP